MDSFLNSIFYCVFLQFLCIPLSANPATITLIAEKESAIKAVFLSADPTLISSKALNRKSRNGKSRHAKESIDCSSQDVGSPIEYLEQYQANFRSAKNLLDRLGVQGRPDRSEKGVLQTYDRVKDFCALMHKRTENNPVVLRAAYRQAQETFLQLQRLRQSSTRLRQGIQKPLTGMPSDVVMFIEGAFVEENRRQQAGSERSGPNQGSPVKRVPFQLEYKQHFIFGLIGG